MEEERRGRKRKPSFDAGVFRPLEPEGLRAEELLTPRREDSNDVSDEELCDINCKGKTMSLPNKKDAPAIYMAILVNTVYPKNDVAEVVEEEEEESQLLLPDEYDDEDSFISVSSSSTLDTHNVPRDSSTVNSFRMVSLLLGLLVGFFIQFSSLGANYLVSSTNKDGATQASFWWFSLVWSLITSALGVSLLLTLRSLLLKGSSRERHQDSFVLLHVECFFAAGTLMGVCMAWMGTDVALGLQQHMMHSAVTLTAALLWCWLLGKLFLPARAESGPATFSDYYCKTGVPAQVEIPLAASTSFDFYRQKSLMEPLLRSSASVAVRPIKFQSGLLGALVGVFIQFSTLGANFLLGQVYGETQHHQQSRILLLSLVWSLVTSIMGIAVLLLVRGLFHMMWSTTARSTHDLQDVITKMEFCFAVGATVGLNLAWTATDLLVLERARGWWWYHVLRNVVVCVGTLLWCRAVLYFCGTRRTRRYDGDDLKLALAV
jgi:cytochrome bd-type quinol oxidase subunit 2